jgi:hypothetical protein
MFTNNFAQSTSNPIPHDRSPDRSRGDKAGAKTNGVVHRSDAKHDQLAAVDAAILFYVIKFRGLSQAATFGKCEAFDRADDVDLTGKETGTKSGRGD